MKSKLKLFMLAFVLCSVMMFNTNAEAATSKSVVIQLEDGNKTLSTLQLEVGNEVDLKLSDKDATKVRHQWQTSNPLVVTVDQNGKLVAHENGIAVIKVVIGDGSQYVCKSLTVWVGQPKGFISMGLPNQNNIKEYNLPLDKKVDFAFYGVIDWHSGVWQVTWHSSDTAVATINGNGLVTPKKEGVTILSMKCVNKVSKEVFPVQDIKLTVTKKGSTESLTTPTPTPTLTPTPSPSPKPTLSPTPSPTPTATPSPTPTSTPTPTPIPLTFNVSVTGERELTITLGREATLKKSDISIKYGSDVWEVDKLTYSEDKLTVKATTKDIFTNNTTYTIGINGAKSTKTARASLGVPTRAELTYSALGKDNAAYVARDEVFDIETELSVKLFSGDIEVTETYLSQGFVEYDVTSSNEDAYTFTGDSIMFYETGKTVKVTATYSYWDSKGNTTEIKATTKSISATKAPAYNMKLIEEWTIVPTSYRGYIDWDNPVHSIVSDDDKEYQLILLISDNYGYKYATHELGVHDDYRRLDDYEAPFIYYATRVEFEAFDNSKYIITSEGKVYAFAKENNLKIAFNVIDNEGDKDTVSFVPLKLLDPAKLDEIVLEQKTIKVSSAGIGGRLEGVTDTVIPLKLLDQYGNVYKGTTNLTISSTNDDVDDAISTYSGPAYITLEGLHIDGVALRGCTNKNSVQFTIKDEETKVSTKFTVNVLDPSYDKNGDIVVTGWELADGEEYDATLGILDIGKTEVVVPVYVYDTSKSGVKVGIRNTNVHLSTSSTTSYNVNNCSEGDIYITVLDPKKKVLTNVTGREGALGFRYNEDNGMIEIVVGTSDSKNPGYMKTLDNGTYTIQAVYISKNDGVKVQTAKKNATITITQNVPTVQYIGTSGTIYDGVLDKDTVKHAVTELLRFKINGEEVKLSEDMIYEVKTSNISNGMRINSVILNIPYDGHTDNGVGYVITISNINRNITNRVQ